MLGNESELSIPMLRRLLECDFEAGELTWRERSVDLFVGANAASNCKAWNKRYAGKRAFTSTTEGYHQGLIFSKHYKRYRVIFTMRHGYWPKGEVDHKDHDKGNDSADNLREATRQQQNKNRTLFSNNKSGHVGVSWYKQTNRWRAAIMIEGKQITLGYYKDINDAVAAREKASLEANYHANHGASGIIFN